MEQHKKWVGLCPNVVPFYAVKCNNDPVLLQTLALLGTGYDCASKSEIEQGLVPLKLFQKCHKNF